MKNSMMIIPVLAILLSGCTFALGPRSDSEGTERQYTGKIIDNACSAAHKDDINSFAQTYDKETAVQCTLGYCLYFNRTIKEFDSESNGRILEYLKRRGSTLTVTVIATEIEGKLHIIELKPGIQ